MGPKFVDADFISGSLDWSSSNGQHSDESVDFGSGTEGDTQDSQSQTSRGSIFETRVSGGSDDEESSEDVDEENFKTPSTSVLPSSIAHERSLPGMFEQDFFSENETVIEAPPKKRYLIANGVESKMASGPQILFSSLHPETQRKPSNSQPLRKALILFLTVGIIYWAFRVSASLQSGQSSTVVLYPLSLFCNLPLVSNYWSKWPCVSVTSPLNPTTPDFTALVQAQAKELQTIIDEAMGMTEVGWKLWKSEMAIADLLSFIGSSDLDGKDVLEEEFRGLLTQVSSIEGELATLGVAILTAAERIVAVNTYALDVLGSLTPRWYELVVPSSRFSMRLAKRFRENFRWTTKVLSESTSDIMVHCKATADSLHGMKSTLKSIHDIIIHERTIALDQQQELHAAFWTRLGGSKGHLGRLGDRLAILGRVENTHTKALKHVHSISEGVLHMQKDVSNILQSASTLNSPVAQLTVQDMRSQLLDVAMSMAGVASSLMDYQKKSRDVRREPKESTNRIWPDSSIVSNI